MKKLYFLFAAAVTTLLSGSSLAQQTLNYSTAGFSRVAGTYTDIQATGTAITVANDDDATSAALPIGFTFNYNGRNFTQFVFNTNGFIRLGSGSITRQFSAYTFEQNASPLHASADSNLILPFNLDLKPGSSTPAFHYQVTGTAPNRVLTIQWKNMADKDTTGAPFAGLDPAIRQFSNLEFQAKLYETTNVVEFVYGTFVAGTSTAAASWKSVGIGLKGTPGNRDGSTIYLDKASTESWNTAALPRVWKDSLEADQHFHVRRSVLPVAGTTYRWAPDAVPVAGDIALVFLQARGREAVGFSVPVAYRAIVRNAGTTAQTNITVRLRVTGANSFTTSATIASLAPNAIDSVLFPVWTPTAAGNNVAKAFVDADANVSNDTARYNIVTTPNLVGYAEGDIENPNGGVGYNTGQGLLLSRFRLAVSGEVRGTRVFIANETANTGQKIYGVITNATGTILGRSDSIFIAAGQLGTWVTLTYRTPVNVTANQDFLVGIAQTAGTPGYFPVGTQTETPTRGNAYFGAALAGGSLTNYRTLGRFMLDAVVGSPSITNDIAVNQVVTLGNVPAGNLLAPFNAYITLRNAGTADVFNTAVTYAFTGANTSSQSVTVPRLRAGIDTTITISGLTLANVGATTLTASVPADQNNANNTRNYNLNVTTDLVSYANADAPSSSVGFNTGQGLLATRYVNGAQTLAVSQVRAYIPSGTNIIGRTFFARLLRQNGVLLDTVARSADVTMTVNNVNTYVQFPLPATAQVPANSVFFVAIFQRAGAAAFPLGTQTETPGQPGAYFGSSNLNPITFSNTTTLGRFMIQAQVAAATSIKGNLNNAVVELYPNPTRGELFVAHNIAKGSKINVRVLNVLGAEVLRQQEVSNGTNFNVNLTGMPAGVYLVKMEANGGELVKRVVVE